MEKIWLKNYPSIVPETINPDAYQSLIQVLQESVHKYADDPAFENFEQTLTYKELLQKSTHLAAYFQKHLHLTKGDRLAIMLPNLLQYPIVLFAALQIGVVIVNINPLYTERELVLPLKDSGAKAIVVLANFAANVEKIIPKTELKHVIVTEVGDHLNPVKRILINNLLRYVKKAVPAFDASKMIRYREALRLGENTQLDPVTVESSDLAFLQYTGGTTGIPKGAMLTHRNIIANILECAAWVKTLLVEGEEVCISALPLYHIFSLTVCCFTFVKIGGLSVLITNPRDLKAFVKKLKKTYFTVFIGVHTLFDALMKQPDFNEINFVPTKLTLGGGMAVLTSVGEKWQEKTHKPLLMGYGLTEASPVVTINLLTQDKFSRSIGLPIPSTDVKIIDKEGKSVPLGSPGELCVKGPQVMKGYWQQPKETEAILSPDGWLQTGDIATMDEQGYIYLIDRKKDMILVSGFNVYPIEIEEVIASHPGVAEVAVIGIPSSHSGESVKAFIVKRDPALTQEDIMKLCKENLTAYKLPKEIEFCSDLPKSNVGKVLKKKLRTNNDCGG